MMNTLSTKIEGVNPEAGSFLFTADRFDGLLKNVDSATIVTAEKILKALI